MSWLGLASGAGAAGAGAAADAAATGAAEGALSGATEGALGGAVGGTEAGMAMPDPSVIGGMTEAPSAALPSAGTSGGGGFDIQKFAQVARSAMPQKAKNKQPEVRPVGPPPGGLAPNTQFPSLAQLAQARLANMNR